jgi:NTE family protein
MHPVSRQVAELRKGGAQVVVVEPSKAAESAIGTNSLDPTRRAPSAEAGRDQAASVAAEIRAAWTPKVDS